MIPSMAHSELVSRGENCGTQSLSSLVKEPPRLSGTRNYTEWKWKMDRREDA